MTGGDEIESLEAKNTASPSMSPGICFLLINWGTHYTREDIVVAFLSQGGLGNRIAWPDTVHINAGRAQGCRQGLSHGIHRRLAQA